MKWLELYCGIGGLSAALAGVRHTVSAAVDIDRAALEVYRANFPHQTTAAEITTLNLAAFDADYWWLSPPCRPFTRRGRGRDVEDSRTQSFLSLVARLPDHRPLGIGTENVPPFAESIAAARLREALHDCGYAWEEAVRCPTEFGIPMRRRRYYLLARREDAAAGDPGAAPVVSPGASQRAERPIGEPRQRVLRDYLQPPDSPADPVPAAWLERWAEAIDIVDADDPHAIVSCFTSAYGRSPVRSGSYLREAGRVRFFRPREIARLMGFDDRFVLPAHRRTAYRLLGNSLAVPVVRSLLLTSGRGQSILAAAGETPVSGDAHENQVEATIIAPNGPH